MNPLTATLTDTRLIDSAEFMQLLKVSEAHFYRLKAAGKLPAPVRLGRSVR